MIENQKMSSSALLVIDVQNGLFNKSIPIYQSDQLLSNISTLVSKAHQKQIPVIYIQHTNDNTLAIESENWQLHPLIVPSNEDILVQKKHGNAFENTELQSILQSRSVNSLVITGLVTHGCVKATSLGAMELGYKVVLVEDGHSSYSKDAPDLITKWNNQLKNSGAMILRTQEIQF